MENNKKGKLGLSNKYMRAALPILHRQLIINKQALYKHLLKIDTKFITLETCKFLSMRSKLENYKWGANLSNWEGETEAGGILEGQASSSLCATIRDCYESARNLIIISFRSFPPIFITHPSRMLKGYNLLQTILLARFENL